MGRVLDIIIMEGCANAAMAVLSFNRMVQSTIPHVQLIVRARKT